jgi:hypothetical protein
MIVGGSVGALIAYAIRDGSQTASQLRKQLGASIDRYTDVPADELNSALILAAADARRGLSALLPTVSIVVIMLAAGLSVHVYRQLFPDLPRWHSYCIAGLVAGLLAWPKQLLERRSIISKLNLRLAER